MAQILGALIACALVYNQWKMLIEAAEAKLLAEGEGVFALTQFTPNGPAGIFAFYLLPGQTIPRVFLNEFVNVSGLLREVSTKLLILLSLFLKTQSAILGTVIWAAMDPTNYFIPPTAGPAVISLA